MEDAADGFLLVVIIIAFVCLFAWIGYDAGYKSGEVNILSGKAPTYHLITNDVGEVNWSKQ